MINELYSYDSYRGYGIFVQEDNGIYHGDIRKHNEIANLKIKALTGQRCLELCCDWIDDEEDKDEPPSVVDKEIV